MPKMNDEQRKTVEMMVGKLDDFLASEDEYSDDGALIFDGQGIDGPCVGYIEPDGKVSWLCCGGFFDR